RRGASRTIVNLVVTMFLAGLWHGAAWTFVVWGLVHGVFLGGHALLRRVGLTPGSVALNRLITFALVCGAFVVFRSPNLGTAGDVLSSMVGLHGFDSATQLGALFPVKFGLLIAALLLFVNAAPNTWQIRIQPRIWQGAVTGLAAAVAIMTISQPHPFIYFQF